MNAYPDQRSQCDLRLIRANIFFEPVFKIFKKKPTNTLVLLSKYMSKSRNWSCDENFAKI